MQQHSSRIVIVEDDEATREMFVMFLEEAGYDVVSTTEHSTSVNLIRSTMPGLVILDLMRGGTFAGWAVLSALRLDPATRHIPIILTSAETKALRERQSELNIRRVEALPKPFSLQTLIEKVVAAIGPAATS